MMQHPTLVQRLDMRSTDITGHPLIGLLQPPSSLGCYCLDHRTSCRASRWGIPSLWLLARTGTHREIVARLMCGNHETKCVLRCMQCASTCRCRLHVRTEIRLVPASSWTASSWQSGCPHQSRSGLSLRLDIVFGMHNDDRMVIIFT